ncbi:response regulator transcription factor [Lentzea sp. CA-135723]|uniref:response regulator transcription factor n=1 Tax=Lentzea sp. CA-135723 TaxID=3239950 RepID=UPI003D901042
MAFAVRHPLLRAGAIWAATAGNQFRLTDAAASVEALDPTTPADLTVVEVSPQTPPQPIADLATTSRVVLLADKADPATSALATRTGAHLVLDHHTEPTDLLNALLHQAKTIAPTQHTRLSRREIETMRHIGDGLTYRQIARRMGLSEATVGTYARRIRQKLNAPTKVQMVVTAMRSGYVVPPAAHAAKA